MTEMKEKEPEVNIDNLVGTFYLPEKHSARLDLTRLYLSLDRLFGQIRAGLHEDLKKMIRDSDPLEYHPEKFDAVYIRLKEPEATIKIFSTWTITCVGCTKLEDLESSIKIAVDLVKLALAPENTPFRTENLTIKLSNVICSSRVGLPLGCGIVQKAFPDKKVKVSNFAGGSYEIPLNGGTVRVFAGGKLTGLGFKDIDLAKKTVLEAIRDLKEALEKYGNEDRSIVCRLERFEPTQKHIEDFAAKLEIAENVKLKAIELMRQYCKNVTRETFGGNPESFAAAAIYIAGILCDRRQSQEFIADSAGITQVTLRNVKHRIIEVLELKIII